MNRNVAVLLVAQFVTAFADNAALFTAVALVMHAAEPQQWYVSALQASFLIAYVLLAPWVGDYSDRRPKAKVLTDANVVKAFGAGLMLAGVEPLLSYAVIGLGAAMYSPAKYGIIPELVSQDALVRVNSWVEGSTILSILLGSLVGAAVADRSVQAALVIVGVSYLLSAVLALAIARTSPPAKEEFPVWRRFGLSMRGLLSTTRARFATLGVSIFWCAAAVLRVILVAWAPVVLMTTTAEEVAQLSMYIAIGIAVGAMVAPKIIPIERLRRARVAAYAMSIAVFLLSFANDGLTAKALLIVAGVCGGLFVVPINAALQDIGYRSIGAGEAVAVQHFFENAAMLAGLLVFTIAAGAGADPVVAMATLGVIMFVAAVLISLRLPKEPSLDIPEQLRKDETE